MPTATATTTFTAAPRKRLMVGLEKKHPFQVLVSAGNRPVQTLNGEFVEKALIQAWVLPLVLLLGVICVALGGFVINNLAERSKTAQITGTASAKETLIAGVVFPTNQTETATAAAPELIVTEAAATRTPPPQKPTVTIAVVAPASPTTQVTPLARRVTTGLCLQPGWQLGNLSIDVGWPR